MNDPELHILILAAGDSRRLDCPKQLLAFDGEPLLHRVCRQALTLGSPVSVVLGARAADMNRTIHDLPLMRIDNTDWREGLASSLRAGLLSLPATADAALVLLCDQAALGESDWQCLIETWCREPRMIAAAKYDDGHYGVPALFPRAQYASLLALSGDRGARELLNDASMPVIGVDMPAAEFDLDTPADIESLQRQLQISIERPALEQA